MTFFADSEETTVLKAVSFSCAYIILKCWRTKEVDGFKEFWWKIRLKNF
jgi:hypothetical protein